MFSFFKRNKNKDAAEKPVSPDLTSEVEVAGQSTAELEAIQSSTPVAAEAAVEVEDIESIVVEDVKPLFQDSEPVVVAQPSVEDAKPIIEDTQPIVEDVKPVIEEAKPAAEDGNKKVGFFARIKQGLKRTSTQFSEGLGNLLLGKKAIDDELLEELETQLLIADVGVEATTRLIDNLTAKVARKQLADSGALYEALQTELRTLLQPVEQPLQISSGDKPFVILVVGVNGVGKTTTIGKLAKRLQNEGKSVMLAAGDTFRAAAVEQLQIWGERNKVQVVAQHTGADSASVIYDAIAAAKARGVDVVIADTAGRLHNKSHLMDELAKVRRVMGKLDVAAPHEVLLVLDAGTGQNAVSQADIFREAAGVTGIALTKLDGTAKGGVIFALTEKHQLPIRFIGVGEGIDDLQPFAAKPFVDALFSRSDQSTPA
jgi:fused signal recognition particle receptor